MVALYRDRIVSLTRGEAVVRGADSVGYGCWKFARLAAGATRIRTIRPLRRWRLYSPRTRTKFARLTAGGKRIRTAGPSLRSDGLFAAPIEIVSRPRSGNCENDGGTTSSNPACSTGESVANLTPIWLEPDILHSPAVENAVLHRWFSVLPRHARRRRGSAEGGRLSRRDLTAPDAHPSGPRVPSWEAFGRRPSARADRSPRAGIRNPSPKATLRGCARTG